LELIVRGFYKKLQLSRIVVKMKLKSFGFLSLLSILSVVLSFVTLGIAIPVGNSGGF
jgi:hypothetical protein